MEYLPRIKGKSLFLFATHGAAINSPHAENAMEGAKSLVTSSQLVGNFNCQGEVKEEFLAKVQKKDPQPPWVKDAEGAVGHPDAHDIAKLQIILEKAVAKLRSLN